MASTNLIDEQVEDFYQKIYKDLDEKIISDEFGGYLSNRVKSGKKKSYNKTTIESRDFNMEFLNKIESCYPALLKIMKDPKKSIRYEQEIVAVEKAKKVNADTVRHLSSHTHLIKEVRNDGSVVPAKVLSTFTEEELAIYENRFIKSLVKRIEVFLERRYEVMRTSLESYELHHLNVQNEFLVSGQNVQIGLDISVKNVFTKDLKGTKKQYERLLYVRELIQSLKGTDFMRALSKAKDIFPPIMKTNIILHNPDFKMCYGLWLYLDQTDGIAFHVAVKEKNYRYEPELASNINNLMTIALASFIKSRQMDDIIPEKLKAMIKLPKVKENTEIEETPTLKPSRTTLEDYRMNEFMLNQTAKYYEASLSGMKESGSTELESLRVVYRQMLEMMDQIYPKVFQIDQEKKETIDLYDRLGNARKKLTVLKMVQKQKQMNIARMGKSQKATEREILSLEKKIKQKELKDKELEKKIKNKEVQKNKKQDDKKAAIEKEKQRIKKLMAQKKNEKEDN